jgi:hypothetical protein
VTAALRDAIVYLVRRAEKTESIRRFLTAYDAHPAGAPHDLVILWKGFEARSLPDEHAALVRGRALQSRWVPDTGFDVDAYWRTAEDLGYERFCFLNTHSEPLADQWLAFLFDALEDPLVGVAGATGSFESHSSEHTHTWRTLLRLPLYRRARWAARAAQLRLHFPPFPNHHVRTTAFVMKATTMRRVRCDPMKSKYAAFRFESGRGGLTAQIEKMGLEVRVVGRDGTAYPPELWPESRTFRLGDQSNLLVADRHTRVFAAADDATKRHLQGCAWGSDPRASKRLVS